MEPVATPEAAAPLVEGGEVAVEVAGIAASPGHLTPGGADLAHGFAVARHVGHDDEHVAAALEGQVLGDGQREPGGEDPLDDRVVRGVEEQRQLTGGGAGLERVADGGRVRVRDAHAGEHDGKGFAAGVSLGGDLGGELEMGETADGEHRELLASHQRREHVDHGDTGEDGVSRRLPAVGFIGAPLTSAHVAPVTGGPPSTGSPRPLQARPSQPSPDGDPQWGPGERHRYLGRIDDHRSLPAPARRQCRPRLRAPLRGGSHPPARGSPRTRPIPPPTRRRRP